MSDKKTGQPNKRSLQSRNFDRRVERFVEQPIWGIPFALPLVLLICLIPVIAFISTPLSVTQQGVMGVGTLFLALWFNRTDGRLASLAMITLSILVSTRYMFWRLTETLGWGMAHRDGLDTFFSFGLVAAEMYAFIVLFLGYFQVLWPLQRKPVALPQQVDEWPTVDIYIPTYNEPLSVVRPTVLASLDVDWPREKLRIYVLDDGRRDEFKAFVRRSAPPTSRVRTPSTPKPATSTVPWPRRRVSSLPSSTAITFRRGRSCRWRWGGWSRTPSWR